jgi:hypothetical protein
MYFNSIEHGIWGGEEIPEEALVLKTQRKHSVWPIQAEKSRLGMEQEGAGEGRHIP